MFPAADERRRAEERREEHSPDLQSMSAAVCGAASGSWCEWGYGAFLQSLTLWHLLINSEFPAAPSASTFFLYNLTMLCSAPLHSGNLQNFVVPISNPGTGFTTGKVLAAHHDHRRAQLEGEGHILTESCFYEIPRSLTDIVNVKQQGDRCYLLIFVTNLMTIGNDGVTHHVPVSPDHVTRTSNNHSRCHVSPGCQAPAGQLATHTAPRNEHWWPGVSVPAWQHPGLPLHSPYLHISYHSLISQ